jgi:hypothetical protein
MRYAQFYCSIKGRPVSARLPAGDYLFYHFNISLAFSTD